MKAKRLLLVLVSLLCLPSVAFAQSETNGSMSTSSKERARIIGKTIDVKTVPMNYGKYSDAKLKDLERRMEERSWGSEDTAWEAACKEGTREAFQRYAAMYPYGAHRSEADKKLIDLDVNDAFQNSHNELPAMNRVYRDDDSPTSVITVENATGYPLTVMYSGVQSKSITIPAGQKGTVCLPNGSYRIAASVPAPQVGAYAGSQSFAGGRYETGYCIVSRSRGTIRF